MPFGDYYCDNCGMLLKRGKNGDLYCPQCLTKK